MNTYNLIKQATEEYSGIPQYFFALYEFNGSVQQSAIETAFESVCSDIYPKLAEQNNVEDFYINSIEFFSEDYSGELSDYSMDYIQAHYDVIIEKNQASPVILNIFTCDKTNQSVFVYMVNHVYLDFTSAKLVNIALSQAYNQLMGKDNKKAIAFDAPNDSNFLKSNKKTLNTSFIDGRIDLLKEMYSGSYIASPLNRVVRRQYNPQSMTRNIVFKHLTFANDVLPDHSYAAKGSIVSALICRAYMQAFDSNNCHYVMPFDLRNKQFRWGLGNFIGGSYVAVDASYSLLESADKIQSITDKYKDLKTFFVMYSLILKRLKFMTKRAIYKKALKYSRKSHFISTNVGQIDRCNGKFARFEGLEATNTLAYSYPLQLSIGISLSVTYFADSFTINLSASQDLASEKTLNDFELAIHKELDLNNHDALVA